MGVVSAAMATVITQTAPAAATAARKPFYKSLWGQVLLGVAIAIVLGYVSPATGEAMRPLGDAFIRLISMVISLVVFCTVVTGIAGMGNLRKVGRVGGKALLYFEIITTIALIFGITVGNLIQTGAGFNADASTLDASGVTRFAGKAMAQRVTDFLLEIIPGAVVDAFGRGNILSVVRVSLLFGFALSSLGPACKPLLDVIESLTKAVFGVVNILM